MAAVPGGGCGLCALSSLRRSFWLYYLGNFFPICGTPWGGLWCEIGQHEHSREQHGEGYEHSRDEYEHSTQRVREMELLSEGEVNVIFPVVVEIGFVRDL